MTLAMEVFPDHFQRQLNQTRDYLLETLSPEQVENWLSLACPAIELQAIGMNSPANSPIVARIGGRPHLPADIPWPRSARGVALNFLMQIDLGVLATSVREGLSHGLKLPESGLLLVFSLTSQSGEVDLDWRDPEIIQGTRLIYVPEGTATPPQQTARGAWLFPIKEFTATGVMTLPTVAHPIFRNALGLGGRDSALMRDMFGQIDRGLQFQIDGPFPRHRIGGWSTPQPGYAEQEYHRVWAGDEPQENWQSLLQIDWEPAFGRVFQGQNSTPGMIHWVTDTTCLSALDRTGFVIQHG
ncbi:hypothetical protein COCCU_11880 [Corynebacterium occultum]|uniref:DUF1963 domain-containing protein n=1 Tax=Corynebacterium occultum TaxID=2675219 RepID=A0A6B8WBP6_9CORY|nr:DUF1963 domain-containing protein [Corynebacterium occultum]QGU08276.1 hypothetical protein COCCU_11880 [Corynebacterium occultum]